MDVQGQFKRNLISYTWTIYNNNISQKCNSNSEDCVDRDIHY